MPLSDADLSALYRGLTPPPEDRRGCPAPEAVARAAAGDLDPAGRDAVVSHVERCRACADDFRIAFGLQPAAGAAHASRGLGQSWTRTFLPQALAASLAIVSAGLLAWNVSLGRRADRLETELARAREPRTENPAPPPSATPPPIPEPHSFVNVPVVDLQLPATVRGEGARPQAIRIGPDTPLVTLIVNTENNRRYQSYTLELIDARGTTVWTGQGLRPDSDATLSVALSASLLRPGAYLFSLTGISGNRSVTLHRYPITVVDR